MKEYCNVPIIDNLLPGDCGLWYDVQVMDGSRLVHCVCPYDKCSSFMEAIQFYMDTFFHVRHTILCVTHHKFSKATLKILAQAC